MTQHSERSAARGLVSAIVATNCFALVVALLVWAPDRGATTQQFVPAQAPLDYSFTWGSGRVNGPINTPVEVHRETMPAELVGLTCDVSGDTNGTESVHPGNVLQVATNGNTFDVVAVEDAPNIEHTFGGTVTLAAEMIFTVQLGTGDQSPNFQTTSITGTATVTCLPPPETSTSTTVPSSSTTPPPPSSTTSPPSPSTVPSSSTVPTTTPPTVTTTTPTLPPDTATTLPPAVSTTSTCRPGSYEIGRDDNSRPICAAVEESG